MTRAKPEPTRQERDEDVELTPHFSAPPAEEKPRRSRKPRSTEPAEPKPKKPRAKQLSGIEKTEPKPKKAPAKPRAKKASTPTAESVPVAPERPAAKRSAPPPALHDDGRDPLRAASLNHARSTLSQIDRFANPAAPPERQRALDSLVRGQSVIVVAPTRVVESPAPPPVVTPVVEPPAFEPQLELSLDLHEPPANDIHVEPANDVVAPSVEPVVEPAHAFTEVMPYQASAPCAVCATGVDPLRAACVRKTDKSFEYFCSRSCREQQKLQDRARLIVVTPAAILRGSVSQAAKRTLAPSVPPSRMPPESVEPVSRRIAPGRATTPVWPWLGAPLASAVPLLKLPYVMPAAAMMLGAMAAVFVARSNASREQAGVLGWLAPALGVSALALAALFADPLHGRIWIATAALALLASWAREHWLERAHAIVVAARAELDARTTTRVRVIGQDGQTADRALNGVRVGDQVWIEQGTVVPVDGVVEEGDAELLPYPQARLTIRRRTGGAVLGGALVISGSLRVRATAVGPKRALFRALATSDRALESVAPSAQYAARVRALAPGLSAMVGACVCAAIAPGSPSTRLAGLGAALVALPVLAASRGVLEALQRAFMHGAMRGAFFRDGAALERAGQVDTALLRVEGTLVPRSYTLVEVHALAADVDRDSLLAWALGAEAAAEGHPLARAIRRHAASLGIEPEIVRRLAYTRGSGVSGLTDSQGALVLGSRAALLQAGVSVAVADREAQLAEQNGHKVVLLALGGHVCGLFVFAQELRSEARLAVQSLFDLGLEVELTSGDHRSSVEALARTLDVLQVKAELTREQREAELRRLREGESRVAVIGNADDAGALLTGADVGVCLDGAPEVHVPGDLRAVSHDVITASSDLRDAAHALIVARAARRTMTQVWALSGLGCGLALLAALSQLPAWACVLAALAIDAACLMPRKQRD